jgi:cell division septal protein FtsQ
MFSRQKSPVKKKFAKVTAPKKRRRQLDPRTVVLLKQGFLGLVLVIVLSLLVTAFWYGTRVEFLTLRTVTVSGGETINHDVVKREVDAALEGDYLGLIPRRFAWWYPEQDVLARVKDVPRVKDPVIERVSGTELTVSFTEYIPHALWCEDRGSDTCYFIDDTGYAFTKAPNLKGGAFPRFHTIGTEPALRAQMIPTDDLRAIELIRERTSTELALPIAFVETDIVRDVFLGVAGGGEIKATLRMTPEETVENLQTILASPEFSDIRPGSFQYIDLRFGSKVFVNEEPLTVATSTATTTDAGTSTAPWAEPLPSETPAASGGVGDVGVASTPAAE